MIDENDSDDERANKIRKKKASSAQLKKLQQVFSYCQILTETWLVCNMHQHIPFVDFDFFVCGQTAGT